MCNQHDRLVLVPNVPGGQSAPIVLDQRDLVRPRNVAVINDNEFIPVNRGIEVDRGDSATSDRAADRAAVQHAVDH